MNSIQEIEVANARRGHHYFEADTMRFFRSRVSSEVEPLPNGGALFITSEQNHGWGGPYPRLFSIRRCNPDGSIDTVGDFQAYATRARAITMTRKLSAWCWQALRLY